MAKTEPQPSLAPHELKAALASGALPSRAQALARERHWVAVGALFSWAGGPDVPLGDLLATSRAVAAALATADRRGDPSGPEGVRACRLAIAEALLRRAGDPPQDAERPALILAADMLAAAGEARRAARTLERAGDDARAAEAWGALGDIDRMEACLSREEERRRRRTAASDALRRFEDLLASGEREAALRAAALIPEGTPDAAAARQAAQSLAARLCRGRAVTLRLPDGSSVRFAALPALLGRDATAEIGLRDPGVSRRHAVVAGAEGGGFTIEDAGSRAGTRLAGVPIAARLPLVAEGEIGIGPTCRLSFRVVCPALLELRGLAGLDRSLHVVAGAGAMPLGDVWPAAVGLTLTLGDGAARLEHDPARPLRVDRRFVGTRCDLLHGDVIESASPAGTLRLEVL